MQKDNQLLHILKPVVASYAKSNPMKTLGIAAGVGAAIVVLKPWRLITLGSLLAVLKARFDILNFYKLQLVNRCGAID